MDKIHEPEPAQIFRMLRPADIEEALHALDTGVSHPFGPLCRFSLDHSGPTHQTGDRSMLPFLLNMNELFEKFVAEWLRQNLPPTHRLRAQSQIILDEKTDLKFIIDLTVDNSRSGTVLYVLDTKYKRPHTPSNDDIAQVTAYAVSKGCCDAILIYPSGATESIDCHVWEIRVRSLTFGLDGELDVGGQAFVENLLLKPH